MNSLLENRLLNDYQHDFPLLETPFAALASELGVAEEEVLHTLIRLQQQGVVSRVGAVFRPRSIGASTLAALAVPEESLEEVAAMVSSYPEVNHNYQREHHYNLWFVVAAPDEVALQRVLKEIEERSACRVLFLPLVEDYHIDLGFDMTGNRRKNASFVAAHTSSPHQPYSPSTDESSVISAIQSGLPLVARPYDEVGTSLGLSEATVIECLQSLIRRGVIKRMGVVVRHHELGYHANAMVVWDIPDEDVNSLGHCLGKLEFVTLCYRRPRRLPAWRYNLFCMIHGHDREEVLARVEEMRQGCGLQHIASEVLFSTRRFKQCGARYARAAA
ncbi:MAG: Lrp/AsnC family transcriptional regulator [Gammaproteobacteria bacterium]|nr:Lrp/AsnC family transcriptional regulator [Gammaproteobacteria bacterium]MBU1731231.1 Lrp/AsnC family transcriptional regulator [Gammaproteobacteria bacterium]MBU1892736.1 Lrp/AsnC family transcriptional regulator [Gammaproteobacteria bacterium]